MGFVYYYLIILDDNKTFFKWKFHSVSYSNLYPGPHITHPTGPACTVSPNQPVQYEKSTMDSDAIGKGRGRYNLSLSLSPTTSLTTSIEFITSHSVATNQHSHCAVQKHHMM